MNVYQQIVAEIKAASNIIITSHKSPDAAPGFLNWLDTSGFLLMTDQSAAVATAFTAADLVFCLDYNGTNRVGYDMQVLLEAVTCKTIMIDHHLNPEDFPTITVSETSASSTSELIVDLIEQSGNGDCTWEY